MRKQRRFSIALTALFLLIVNLVFSQQTASPEVIKRLRQAYSSIPTPEISFERFVEINRHVYEAGPGLISVPSLTVGTSCARLHSWKANGDFESGLDQTQWLGAYGTFSGLPNPASMTDGFSSGPLTSSGARQTIVTAGVDPNAGISIVAPNGGTRALRLGNSVNGNGTEMLAKTVTISSKDSATLVFWYAVVFEDPNHALQDQPAFTVRVIDCATGAEIGGVCDLGNGTNKLISDVSNPFFQSARNGAIAYRNWTRAEISLTQHVGKKVTIQLINNDCNLGGHYGYVYLDNVDAGLSIREPDEDLREDNKIKNDADAISELLDDASLNRDGISADGVTRLLIIGHSSKNLTLSLPSDKDGSLSALNDQGNKKTSLQVTPVTNSKGEKIIIAIYTAPDGYGPQALATQGRQIKITVEETGNPGGNKQELPLSVFTPPVVLMHGLWSDGQTWENNGVTAYLNKAGFSNVRAVTYTSYKSFDFSTDFSWFHPDGVKELDKAAEAAIEEYKSNKIAATQVDVVAHSMGGLMSRSYIRSSRYKTELNYQQGSIHKLITIGTPHHGTPMANLLWRIKDSSARLPGFQRHLDVGTLFSLGGKPIRGAVEDMQNNSAALTRLGNSKVKAHTITGQYGPDAQSTDNYNRWNGFINSVDPVANADANRLNDLFGESHDLIVGISSQKGGLTGGSTSSFNNVIHSPLAVVHSLRNIEEITGNTELSSAAIHQEVKDLLLSNNAAAFATELPTPVVLPSPKKVELITSTVISGPLITAQDQNDDHIEIITPVRGTSLLAKDSIILELKTVGNVTPASGFFMVNGIGIGQIPDTPPYRVVIKFKNPPVGQVSIVAFVRDSLQGTLFADTMGIIIKPSGRLISFTVSPDSLLLDSLLMQRPLIATGKFVNGADTSAADLSHIQNGTTYTPRKGSAIVKVDDKGVVTALNTGIDLIDVRYSTSLVTIPVRVTSTCSVPKPVITRSGDTLISSSATGNQWYLNGDAIDSSTSDRYVITGAGDYSVQVIMSCASLMSDVLQVTPGTTYYQDLDNDGYGNPAVTVTGLTQPAGYVTRGGDCHDWDPAINPGATEICNGKDDNCNGLYDETCTVYYRDEDGDGYGLWHQNIVAMTQPAGYAAAGGDCNDNDASIHPGAIEICNWKDDDCDGQIDEACRVFYRDEDGDGYGNYALQQYAVTAPAGYVATGGDCNDNNATIHPGAAEACNGTDDNCNGISDEFCVMRNYYRDADGDGYGRNDDVIFTGIQPPGYVLMNGDCHDWDPAIHPWATETCNWKDDDCDGLIDENCIIVSSGAVNAGSLAVKPAEELKAGVEFNIAALPNPSRHEFTVNLQGNFSKGKVSLKIYDNTGRLIETKPNLPVGQTIKIGAGYKAGLYVLQAEQGEIRKTIKVVKL